MTRIKLWATDDYSMRDYMAAKTEDKKLASVFFTNNDMTDEGWVLVGEADVALIKQASDNELRQGCIESYEQQIKKVEADAFVKINELKERIVKLKALPEKVI